jgi:DNA end-binding protein Ku
LPPRSIFNATISFGAVNVPIKLHSATENKTVSFREVHLTDGAPLEHRRIDPETGEVVDYKDIVKGFEVAEGEYVVLTKEEIKAAAGERTKTIPIEDFVPVNEVEPEYFDKTYYLGMRDGGEEGYLALLDALDRTGRAGIGRMTFHDREYLVAIRALDGVLGLHTMRFADEVVPPEDHEMKSAEKGPSDREIKMAGSLVDALADDFKPSD